MDGNQIVNAAKNRFDKDEYVYKTQKAASDTVDVGKGIQVQEGKKDGHVQTGIGIDCSNLVHQSLLEAGYNVSYLNTSAIKNGSGGEYYSKIDTSNLKSGDIVMFNGHMGIVTSYDAKTKTGTYYGSQSSTGPSEVSFTTDSSLAKGTDGVQYWGLKNGKPVIGAYRVKDSAYDPVGAQQQLTPINELLDEARKDLTPTPKHHSSLDDFEALVLAATESGLGLETGTATAELNEDGEVIYAAFEVPEDMLEDWAAGESLDALDLIEASGIELSEDLRAEVSTLTVEIQESTPSYPTIDTSSYAAWTQSRAAEIGAYKNDPAALALVSDPDALALYGSAMAVGAVRAALVNPSTSNVLMAVNATVKASVDMGIALDKNFLQSAARQLGIQDDPGATEYGPENLPDGVKDLRTAGEKLADYISTSGAALSTLAAVAGAIDDPSIRSVAGAVHSAIGLGMQLDETFQQSVAIALGQTKVVDGSVVADLDAMSGLMAGAGAALSVVAAIDNPTPANVAGAAMHVYNAVQGGLPVPAINAIASAIGFVENPTVEGGINTVVWAAACIPGPQQPFFVAAAAVYSVVSSNDNQWWSFVA